MAKGKNKSFLGQSRSWATKKKLFGPQAFLKFVILTFVECLTEESDQFVFKGGNLLWAYIGTPRQTVDLDLATRTLDRPEKIKAVLERACAKSPDRGVAFSLSRFEVLEGKNAGAAAARIEYATDQGVKNGFELDIVFALPTDIESMLSPLGTGLPLSVASIENIIADKISASARFEAGNTRLKDFDDLWRISRSQISVDAKRLTSLLKQRNIPSQLNPEWISSLMGQRWNRHAKPYGDLPMDIEKVFSEINAWLKTLTS